MRFFLMINIFTVCLFCFPLFCLESSPSDNSPIYSYLGKEGILTLSLENTENKEKTNLLVGSQRKKSEIIRHEKKSFILNKMESYYDSFIYKYSKLYKVPSHLIKSIIRCESHFNRTARSSQGAIGLMQLIPSTGKKFGAKDLFNPDQNIKAGVKYLAWLLKMFDGNLQLALSAYNAGPGNVQKYNGVPPFKETRKYLKKVDFFSRYYSQKPLQINRKEVAEYELFEKAMKHVENGEKIRSINLFRQASESFKPADVAYFNIGYLYDEMGYSAHAEQNYLSAIKENPYLYEAYNNLAIIYEKQIRYDKALKILKKFLPFALSRDRESVEKVILELKQLVGDHSRK